MVSLFVLKGKIRFSKNVEDLKSEIGEIIEKAEITVFTKGVPKGCEGAKVEEWELKENTIYSAEDIDILHYNILEKTIEKNLKNVLQRFP